MGIIYVKRWFVFGNDGSKELAPYILMQRIFPPASLCYLVREGTCVRDNAVLGFGIFGAYLR